MQHNRSGRKLGRTTGHRLALFRNQLASLFSAERIVTTLPKAKELRPLAERMVTQGKRGTVHARRLVGRWIQSRDVIKKLFDDIAPRFAARPGGYLRIVKLGPRIGDGAEMAVLEFVDFQLKKKAAPEKAEKGAKGEPGKAKGKAAEAGEAEEGAAAAAAEKPAKARKPRKTAAVSPAAQHAAEKKAGKAEPKGKAHGAKGGGAKKTTSAPKKIGGS